MIEQLEAELARTRMLYQAVKAIPAWQVSQYPPNIRRIHHQSLARLEAQGKTLRTQLDALKTGAATHDTP